MKFMRWPACLAVGFVAGLAIAYVDNFAFQGEVSPIVIVVMLVAIAITATSICGRHGWVMAGAAWMCLPLAHFIKHILGLPDTLHPNTYTSILMLATFTFVVTILGAAAGILIHRGITKSSNRNSGSA